MKLYKPKTNPKAKKFKSNLNKRDSRQKRGYDGEWYSYRARFLKANPKCYLCGMKSTTVDHILRARGNMEHFKNNHNHIPCCASCHSTFTGRFDRKEVQDLKGKLAYIEKMRKFNKCTVKVCVVKYSK